ncbi:hypothetical protein D3C71_1645480 [compost metagenome]
MLRQVAEAAVLVAGRAQFADGVATADTGGHAHQQPRLVGQLGLAGINEEVLDGRASHAVPLGGDHHDRIGGAQLLLVPGPGTGVFGRPQRQRALAEVDDAAGAGAGLVEVDQALADEAGDLARLAVGAAGAGDQDDVQHLGVPC